MVSNSMQCSQGSPLATKSYLGSWPFWVLGLCLPGLLGLLSRGSLLPKAAAQPEQAFPYVAYVLAPEAMVRSGPGQRHYPTARLPGGFAVQVYRHDLEDLGQEKGKFLPPDNHWCAIRPPAGSFSWIESHQVRKRTDDTAEIVGDRAVVRVGSRLSARRSAVQVVLTRGELVKLAKEGASADGQWLAIEPPAGEFRWVRESRLSRQPPQGAQHFSARPPAQTPLGQTQWKSQYAIRRARQSRQEKHSSQASVSLAVAPSQVPPRSVPDVTQETQAQKTLAEPIDIIAGSPAATREAQFRQSPSSTLAATPSPVPPISKPRGLHRTISPRIHFHDLAANLPIQAQPSAAQKTTGPTPAGQPTADASENTSRASNESDRLGELQVRLSQMVVQDPTQWQFDQIRREADSLLSQAESPILREETRDLLDQLTLFERVRKGKLESDRTLARSNRPGALLAAQGESSANTTASLASPHLHRQMDMRKRAQSDLSTGLNRQRLNRQTGLDRETGRNRGNTPDQQVALLEESPNAVRYDAVGLLKPVVSRRNNSPHYALVDDEGKVVSFVTPTPDVNLQPYIGRRIGVRGTRGFMPEYRRAHVTASRVTPILR